MRKNLHLLCFVRAADLTSFPVAIMALYWQGAGMSLTAIMLLQAWFGLVVTVGEFPGGYVADRIGYRRALVLGLALRAAGWALYAATTEPAAFIAVELLLGVGGVLISGTDGALLYESLAAQGEAGAFQRWLGRMLFCSQICAGAAALLAGPLYTVWPRLPFVLQLVATVCAVLAAANFEEPARTRPKHGDHWAQVRKLFRHAFVDNRALRTTIIVGTLFSLATFFPVWLIQVHLHRLGVPVAYLGAIWAAANFVVAAGASLSHRLASRFGVYASLWFALALGAVGYVGLAGLAHAAAFVFYFGISAMRGLSQPLLGQLENLAASSENRAGLLSIRSMLMRGTFAVLGPLFGWVADRYGTAEVFLVIGSVITLTLALALSRAARPAPAALPVSP